jgi:hypothetical protein
VECASLLAPWIAAACCRAREMANLRPFRSCEKIALWARLIRPAR